MESDKPEDPTAATVTATEADKPKEPEKVFTAAQVEEIVKARLARVKKEPKPEPTVSPKEETKSDPTAAEVKQRLDFMEAFADLGTKVDKDGRQFLESVFKAQGLDAMTKVAALMSKSEAKPAAEAPKAEPVKAQYKSPGAPSGASESTWNPDPSKWTSDEIRQMQANGTFLENLKKSRATMPGGSGGLFTPRIPGK